MSAIGWFILGTFFGAITATPSKCRCEKGGRRG